MHFDKPGRKLAIIVIMSLHMYRASRDIKFRYLPLTGTNRLHRPMLYNLRQADSRFADFTDVKQSREN